MGAEAVFCTGCGSRLPEGRSTRLWWVAAAAAAAVVAVLLAVLLARDGAEVRTEATVAPAVVTPQQLKDVLLQASVEQSELPQGFSEPKVVERELTHEERRHNILAIVDIDLGVSPDYQAYIAYAIYPTEADAKTAFAESDKPTRGERFTGRYRPRGGVGAPAQCLNWDAPHMAAPGARFGVTECQAAVGVIIVLGASVLQSATDHGHGENAQALLRAGLAHLDRVRPKA